MIILRLLPKGIDLWGELPGIANHAKVIRLAASPGNYDHS
jgi:hypothetical protein